MHSNVRSSGSLIPAQIVGFSAMPSSLVGEGSKNVERHVCITVRFGRRLRALRLERKFTQVQLAQHLGIDRSFLSDVERGTKTISLSYLETIAQGFDMPLDKLLAGL